MSVNGESAFGLEASLRLALIVSSIQLEGSAHPSCGSFYIIQILNKRSRVAEKFVYWLPSQPVCNICIIFAAASHSAIEFADQIMHKSKGHRYGAISQIRSACAPDHV